MSAGSLCRATPSCRRSSRSCSTARAPTRASPLRGPRRCCSAAPGEGAPARVGLDGGRVRGAHRGGAPGGDRGAGRLPGRVGAAHGGRVPEPLAVPGHPLHRRLPRVAGVPRAVPARRPAAAARGRACCRCPSPRRPRWPRCAGGACTRTSSRWTPGTTSTRRGRTSTWPGPCSDPAASCSATTTSPSRAGAAR
ncbi:hypothetical protein PAHAL_2G334600 [Panicum hallii]|uniref:Uncharacterized protein n=1 Tax=Panicum hallii TaxID=206008 RepID=A0A2S3H004_9POAL|nr:hypothetical protein PAHAL_2G334600 [Panicum hallii]